MKQGTIESISAACAVVQTEWFTLSTALMKSKNDTLILPCVDSFQIGRQIQHRKLQMHRGAANYCKILRTSCEFATVGMCSRHQPTRLYEGPFDCLELGGVQPLRTGWSKKVDAC